MFDFPYECLYNGVMLGYYGAILFKSIANFKQRKEHEKSQMVR